MKAFQIRQAYVFVFWVHVRTGNNEFQRCQTVSTHDRVQEGGVALVSEDARWNKSNNLSTTMSKTRKATGTASKHTRPSTPGCLGCWHLHPHQWDAWPLRRGSRQISCLQLPDKGVSEPRCVIDGKYLTPYGYEQLWRGPPSCLGYWDRLLEQWASQAPQVSWTALRSRGECTGEELSGNIQFWATGILAMKKELTNEEILQPTHASDLMINIGASVK